MGTESTQFKDWFDGAAAEALGAQVARGAPGFDVERFVAQATDGLGSLEFSGRVQRFADGVAEGLGALHGGRLDFVRALQELEAGLPGLDVGTDEVTKGWLQWPVGDFVARYGFVDGAPVDVDRTYAFMTELTQRFTSEFAVRPYVAWDPKDAARRLLGLVGHPSAHVRRWCSEGLRPRLPWGKRLDAVARDPELVLPVLDALFADESEYVRRSVANCLGDVAKDHLGVACRTAAGWLERGALLRTVKHALRAPVKAGAPEALAVLGYGAPDGLEVDVEVEPRAVVIGEDVRVKARLVASKPVRALVDLRVDYRKANGGTGPKVFKWTERELAAGEELVLEKSLAMVERSTRRLHPGEHGVTVQVNGVGLANAGFGLATERT